MRRPISQLHPALYDMRVAELRLERRLRDRLNDTPFATTLSETRLPIAMVRHGSLQLRVSVGSTHLRGVIATERAWPFTYHVEERDHHFTRADDGSVYRDNELWRRVADRSTGRVVETSLLTLNHALVKYPVDAADLASIEVMAT